MFKNLLRAMAWIMFAGLVDEALRGIQRRIGDHYWDVFGSLAFASVLYIGGAMHTRFPWMWGTDSRDATTP